MIYFMLFARLLDIISTLLGVHKMGIPVEVNPVVRFYFEHNLFLISQLFWTLFAIWWGKFTEQENKIYGLIGVVSLCVAFFNFLQYFYL